MISNLLKMLSYPFMQRALVVGILVSLCAALLGVSLVLKRYSMIGDGLSHVGFGSLAIATALGFAPLAFTIPVVVLAAFLLLRMNESSKIKGDAAIGLISSSALAIGVITVSWSSGMNTDVNNYMFGSILAMSDEDVVLSVVLSIVVLILFVLYYNRIFAVTFDETFAKATGVRAEVYNMLLAFLTAITTVLGFPITIRVVLCDTCRERLNTLIHDIVEQSRGTEYVRQSAEIAEGMRLLRELMFANVYRNPEAKKEEEKAKKMLISLYTYYQEHPEQMSREYRNLIGCGEDKTQVVCDYIAGMTDQYSMHKYEELFVPKAWAVY